MNRRIFLQAAAGSLVGATVKAGLRKSKPTTVAVIGHTGHGNYGHGMDTLWLSFPQVKLISIADQDKDGLQKARERLKAERVYTNYQEMLRKEQPDLLCVAPRHIHEHRDMVMTGIKYGVKGIYVEKPFCRNLGEAEDIVASAESSGVKIALAHRNRYHPVLPRVQELMDSGVAGEILEIKMRGKEDHRGGAHDLWVLGSHVLNLAPLFSGKLVACSATLYQDNRRTDKTDLREGDEGIGPVAGNRLHARFDSEKGIPVYFDSVKGKGTSDANFGMQIIGTKGIFDIRIDSEPLVHFLPVNINKPKLNGQDWIAVSSQGIGEKESVNNLSQLIEGHQAAVIDLMKCIQTNQQPLCNMYEGKATVEAIMAVFRSHVRNGQRVLLSDSERYNPLLDLK